MSFEIVCKVDTIFVVQWRQSATSYDQRDDSPYLTYANKEKKFSTEAEARNLIKELIAMPAVKNLEKSITLTEWISLDPFSHIKPD